MKRISFSWITSRGVVARVTIGLIVAGFGLLPLRAHAAFHLMEIEQVVGGVGGDQTAQAVQLRLRFLGQNLVSGAAALIVRDATGANPVTLSTFPGANPANNAGCARILLTTAAMVAKTTPAVTGAYTMVAIPPSYLAAGSLTFESAVGGQVWWRTSWGGAGYTGAGTTTSVGAGGNDDDGNANPAVAGALPTATATALKFNPACATASTNNAAQYSVTPGAAVLTNNAGGTFTVNAPPPIPVFPTVTE